LLNAAEKCWEGPGYHRRDVPAPQSTKDVLRAGEVASRGQSADANRSASGRGGARSRRIAVRADAGQDHSDHEPAQREPSHSAIFEELATRCQDDIRACAVLTGD